MTNFLANMSDCHTLFQWVNAKKDVTPLVTHWSYIFLANPSICENMVIPSALVLLNSKSYGNVKRPKFLVSTQIFYTTICPRLLVD